MAIDELRRLLGQLPPEAMIPAGWLLDRLETGDAQESGITDLTVEEVAARYSRTPAAIRAWCRDGWLPGAYRLQGREGRIPATALQELRRGHGPEPRPRPTPSRRRPADLGAWRTERGADR